MPTREELKDLQSASLFEKVILTQARIREWVSWYGTEGTYVSFSGGKDSTVLLHIVRQMYPDMEAVFVNTGLEYPEIQSFVKSFENVTILRPKLRFDKVIRKYGYPFIGKNVAHNVKIARNCPNGKTVRNTFNPNKTGKFAMYKWLPLASVDFLISEKCCDVMKKAPAKEYQKTTGKVPIIATMAEESLLRETIWLKQGCNTFRIKSPRSAPMSFWTEQDVLRYIKKNNLSLASVYGDVVYKGTDGLFYNNSLCENKDSLSTTGCHRSRCLYCCFGVSHDRGESRFQLLKKTHPRQYEYCMGGGGYDVDGLWKPTKTGLGLRHCIDEINKIYGQDFIRY